MATIIPINATDLLNPTSREAINTNFNNLNNAKAESTSQVLTVGVAGAYTTIQAALNAAPTTGCIIQLLDPLYNITSPLLIKSQDTIIQGVNAEGTVIACDGSIVTTLIAKDPVATAKTIGRCGLRNISLYQSNITVQGIGLDASNMSLNIYENVSITGFGSAVRMNDIDNFTFFNRFADIKIFVCNNGFNMTSTNAINDNMFMNIRIGLNTGGNGKGVYMNNGQANTWYNLNTEPGTGAGITGVYLDTANVIDTTFVGYYAENNATNINLNGCLRATFIGSTSTGALTSNITDNGINSTFISCRSGNSLFNQTSPFNIIENSNNTAIALQVKNGTAFAHTGSELAVFQLLNGSDTSTVLQLLNAGTGDTLAMAGVLKTEIVTTNPSVPTTGLREFSKKITGQTFKMNQPLSGNPFEISPAIFTKKIGYITYYANGANFYGNSDSTTTGTPTFNVLASTNLLSSVQRRIVTSPASAGNSASMRYSSGLDFWIGNATGLGGLFFVTQFALDTVVANSRFFVGFNASASLIASVEPSSLTNMFGFGADAGESNISWMNNDGSGTATKTSLGSNFPAQTSGAFYEARIYIPPNTNTVYYSLKRLDTAQFIEGSVTTDIPSNTTFLTWHLWMNNGATASAVAMSNAFIYTQTEY